MALLRPGARSSRWCGCRSICHATRARSCAPRNWEVRSNICGKARSMPATEAIAPIRRKPGGPGNTGRTRPAAVICSASPTTRRRIRSRERARHAVTRPLPLTLRPGGAGARRPLCHIGVEGERAPCRYRHQLPRPRERVMSSAPENLESYLSGRWLRGEGIEPRLVDPVKGDELATVSAKGVDLKGALEFARKQGQGGLRSLSYAERGKLVGAVADVLVANRARYEEIAI